ncbi:diacylglycerol kinase family protein [Bacillus sp. BRMEA1]|uniref:diacylglycerol kinase family protein n=1 Tax=Neobacillus endophyticus TaxID=2738405 RepID=UPI00156648ED|nr:diacylglycerol kinase family protein [Neobacillus endophyticus]NRD80796.1 diacylglycerol kinase family protein [Neobacillus endophyticus]
MNMDSRDNRNKGPAWQSFSYAFEGILIAIKEERNMRFHLCSSVVVIFLAFYFSISKIEWVLILLLICGMFALEIINTAIERVVDLSVKEYHPLAKQAKDLAAGAVLVYAILSVAAGTIIFGPYFLKFITNL